MADVEFTDFLDTDKIRRLVCAKGEKMVFKKNDFFCTVGKQCPYIAYVVKGSFIYTHDTYKAKRRILAFAFEKELIAGYTAEQVDSPAIYNIQALENSVVIRYPIKNMNQLIRGDEYRAVIAEHVAFNLAKRLISVTCDSPQERYLALIKRVPDILNRTSLRNVASYLGVSHEFLSRMRTEMLKDRPSGRPG